MTSPESTRPCHGCRAKWNGTLDIAASGLGTECAVGDEWGKHSHPVGHDATERTCAAKKWQSGRVPPERFCER